MLSFYLCKNQKWRHILHTGPLNLRCCARQLQLNHFRCSKFRRSLPVVPLDTTRWRQTPISCVPMSTTPFSTAAVLTLLPIRIISFSAAFMIVVLRLLRHAGGRYLSMSSSRSRIFDDVWRGGREEHGKWSKKLEHMQRYGWYRKWMYSLLPPLRTLPWSPISRVAWQNTIFKTKPNTDPTSVTFWNTIYLWRLCITSSLAAAGWRFLFLFFPGRNLHIMHSVWSTVKNMKKIIIKKKVFNCMPWQQDPATSC